MNPYTYTTPKTRQRAARAALEPVRAMHLRSIKRAVDAGVHPEELRAELEAFRAEASALIEVGRG